MNKKTLPVWTAGILLLLSPGLAQISETALPHDLKQVRYELEIMEGILQKTLSFASDTARRGRRGFSVFLEGEISSFYLDGQGALFMVNVPMVRAELASRMAEMEMVFDEELRGQLARLEEVDAERAGSALRAAERHLRSAQRQLEREMQQLRRSMEREGLAYSEGRAYAPAVPLPPEPPQPPEPPEPAVARSAGVGRERTPEQIRAEVQARKKALQQHVESMRAEFEEQRKLLETRQQELDAKLEQIKEALVEALAKHADSLTIVAADEHVTLILDGGDRVWFPDGSRGERASVISVKKSDITAFSRGQITLEEFKSRARNYTN